VKYRRLGKTELQVSMVGVGAWQFGGEWGRPFTPAEVSRLLERAKELGINLIDTAECYGGRLSKSLIGQAIENERDAWLVATKFGYRFSGLFEREQPWLNLVFCTLYLAARCLTLLQKVQSQAIVSLSFPAELVYFAQ
jgi:aryl-alcohol dehydrogenase-like predicted oxidoreductase